MRYAGKALLITPSPAARTPISAAFDAPRPRIKFVKVQTSGPRGGPDRQCNAMGRNAALPHASAMPPRSRHFRVARDSAPQNAKTLILNAVQRNLVPIVIFIFLFSLFFYFILAHLAAEEGADAGLQRAYRLRPKGVHLRGTASAWGCVTRDRAAKKSVSSFLWWLKTAWHGKAASGGVWQCSRTVAVYLVVPG